MPRTGPENALIAYANLFQFRPEERVSFPRVESRMLLLCRTGRGRVTINGVESDFPPGRFFFLPWGHRIEYVAAARNPFLVAGVHLVPWHDRGVAPVYTVAHGPRDALAGDPARRDVELPGLEGIVHGMLDERHPLRLLMDYIVGRAMARGLDEEFARRGAVALLEELAAWSADPAGTRERLPAALRNALRFIEDHLHQEQLDVAAMEDALGVSRSTLERLFRGHLRASPKRWINQRRVERAQGLLRTSRLGVARIGESVGVPDPYQFSRLFKRMTGESPLAYRGREGGL